MILQYHDPAFEISKFDRHRLLVEHQAERIGPGDSTFEFAMALSWFIKDWDKAWYLLDGHRHVSLKFSIPKVWC